VRFSARRILPSAFYTLRSLSALVVSYGLGAAVLSGCGASPSPTPPAPAAADPCAVEAAAPPRGDTVHVALFAPVEPANAPVPANDAERLVFRQLYEAMVRVDCARVVRPALASRWRAEDGERRWVFEISPEARFWDGTPVDAEALRAAWVGTPGLPVEDVQPSGDRSVTVSLGAPRSIEAFGDAAWAIVKHIPESRWALGTGPVWVGGWQGDGPRRVLLAAPTPDAPDGTPTLEFRTGAGDPRDVLDQATDVAVTRDAGAVRYAEGRGDWRTVPLPWDRVYGLAAPVRSRSGTTTQLDAVTQGALARDAVRDDARAPEPNPWWADPRCPPETPGVADSAEAPPAHPSVVVPDGDRVATDLVSRLVARSDAELADLLGVRPGPLRAEPLPQAPYHRRLAAGDAVAFVILLPGDPLDRCRAAAELRASARWLHQLGAWSANALAPLVETRAHMLLRGNTAAQLDGDGGVRLVPGRSP